MTPRTASTRIGGALIAALLAGDDPPADQRHHEHLDVGAELEDPEDPQQADHPDGQQVLAAGKQQAQVGREDRQQVDKAEETQRVTQRPPDADQPEGVLDGEENREKPLDCQQNAADLRPDAVDAVEHDGGDADDDAPQQDNVEGPAGCGLSLEYGLMEDGAPV